MSLLRSRGTSIGTAFVVAVLLFIPDLFAGSEPAMLIPGDFRAIARIAGLEEPADASGLIERIFTAVLKSEPPSGNISARNQIQAELISYLEEHAQFRKFLQQEQLAPAGVNLEGPLEMRFKLSGSGPELEKTKRLLAFFGIGSRFRKSGADEIKLEISEGGRALKRTILYDSLQVHLSSQDGQIRFTLGAGRSPMIIDEERWDKILPGKSKLLFLRFLEKPDGMRLYLALSACSNAARDALIVSVPPGRLFDSSEALLLFGSNLRFEGNRLIYPGSGDAWSALPGSPPLSVNALLSAGSMPLLFYSAVSAAPYPVQQYLTASPERLRAYFDILKPFASSGFQKTVAALVGQELVRIFRQLTVQPDGLVLDLGPVTRPLLHWIAPEKHTADGSGPVVITPEIMASLLPRPGKSPYGQRSRAGYLEFFRQLKETQPESISRDSVASLMKDPEQASVFLELIADLAPDSSLLADYIDYCAKVAGRGAEGWNLNRTRTSQSIFFLLSALQREGALTEIEANRMLGKALQAFNAEDEAAFAARTAEFISSELLVRLSAGLTTPDPLLAALSGRRTPLALKHNGRELVIDWSRRRHEELQDTLESQAFTPIPVLLEMYALLRKIDTGVGSPGEDLSLLLERIDEIRTAEKSPGAFPGAFKAGRNSIAQAQLDSIKRELESAASRNRRNPASSLARVSAELHTELGVSLLAYCYAYGAMPDTYVLTFDPNFVRKHRFYRTSPLKKPQWTRTRFSQEEAIGASMDGSLAGLGFELMRLQIAQSNRAGISADADIAPAILQGIRKIRPDLRTDRSQQYVALACRLGSGLITRMPEDPKLAEWIDEALKPLVSPRRLEQLQQGAAKVLSPSELFLLGHTYLNSFDHAATQCSEQPLCAAVSRLAEIVPPRGTKEYNVFLKEVSQYGILLRSRTGLSRFSIDMLDSYERLEKHLDPEYLYDRICDLKIRIAELNYSLGLPATLGEIQGNAALDAILPPYSTSGGDWQYAIRRINELTEKSVLGWINEFITRGSLSFRVKDPGNPDL